MDEKLCLQWNEFHDNAKNAFGDLRDGTDFVDVTLASEDGRQIEAHKVIIAASSPFFRKILIRNKNSHPLIYMRGMKYDELAAIVDFLYYGEANVNPESLDSFFEMAEELQLKGFEGSKDQNEPKEADQLKPKDEYKTNPKLPFYTRMETYKAILETQKSEIETFDNPSKKGSNTLVLPKASVMSSDIEELDKTVKSMMETGETMLHIGKRQKRAKICKACGKEGESTDIKRHIEAYHLESVSLSCGFCDKILQSRNALRVHVSRYHVEI